MNCLECQSWIADALDGLSSEATRAGAEQHLAACGACRSFQRASLALEPQLKQQAGRAHLPEDFISAVMLRLPEDQQRLAAEEIMLRREQFEREHREALALLRRRVWPRQVVVALSWLAVICVIVVAAWLALPEAETILLRFTPTWLAFDGMNGSLAMAMVVALVAVIWNWKGRDWRWRLPRRIQMVLRTVRL